MLGYGASYDGAEDDGAISRRLKLLSEMALCHPLISPAPVKAPDEELAAMEGDYLECAKGPCTVLNAVAISESPPGKKINAPAYLQVELALPT